jgi:benzoate-CoA ligase
VSPVEVEAVLVEHPAVLEAAVVGREDEERLLKPQAFVVLADPGARSPALAEELQRFVRQRLPAYKCPRWVEFANELPRTATGKLQRFRLRRA